MSLNEEEDEAFCEDLLFLLDDNGSDQEEEEVEKKNDTSVVKSNDRFAEKAVTVAAAESKPREEKKAVYSSSSSSSRPPARSSLALRALDTDCLSRHQISSRAMSDKELESVSSEFKYIPLLRFSRDSQESLTAEDCCTVFIASEICTRQSKKGKGKEFSIWQCTTLDESASELLKKPLKLFLFGAAHETHARASTKLGSLFLLLNPEFMDNNGSSSSYGGTRTMCINSDEQLRRIGVARQFAFCAAKRKDGKPCTMPVNKEQGKWCDFHVISAHKKAGSSLKKSARSFGKTGSSFSSTSSFGAAAQPRLEQITAVRAPASKQKQSLESLLAKRKSAISSNAALRLSTSATLIGKRNSTELAKQRAQEERLRAKLGLTKSAKTTGATASAARLASSFRNQQQQQQKQQQQKKPQQDDQQAFPESTGERLIKALAASSAPLTAPSPSSPSVATPPAPSFSSSDFFGSKLLVEKQRRSAVALAAAKQVLSRERRDDASLTPATAALLSKKRSRATASSNLELAKKKIAKKNPSSAASMLPPSSSSSSKVSQRAKNPQTRLEKLRSGIAPSLPVLSTPMRSQVGSKSASGSVSEVALMAKKKRLAVHLQQQQDVSESPTASSSSVFSAEVVSKALEQKNEIIAQRSINDHLQSRADKKREQRFDALQERDQTSQKLQSLMSITLKSATYCRQCQTVYETLPNPCRASGHETESRKSVVKRFFLCLACNKRTSTLNQKHPSSTCPHCSCDSAFKAISYAEFKNISGARNGGVAARALVSINHRRSDLVIPNRYEKQFNP